MKFAHPISFSYQPLELNHKPSFLFLPSLSSSHGSWILFSYWDDLYFFLEFFLYSSCLFCSNLKAKKWGLWDLLAICWMLVCVGNMLDIGSGDITLQRRKHHTTKKETFRTPITPLLKTSRTIIFLCYWNSRKNSKNIFKLFYENKGNKTRLPYQSNFLVFYVLEIKNSSKKHFPNRP